MHPSYASQVGYYLQQSQQPPHSRIPPQQQQKVNQAQAVSVNFLVKGNQMLYNF